MFPITPGIMPGNNPRVHNVALSGQQRVPGLSIANTMNPQQKQPYRSLIEPREISPDDWKFALARSPQTWSGMPPNWQSDNFFVLSEPSTNFLKDGMFGRLTGQEPIFGHLDSPINPLDQNQTNRAVNELYKRTQFNWNMGLQVLKGDPSTYPQTKDYYNYQGSRQI